ncbi:MAG: response regulator [Planctomycetota bacterium]|nr:response regulator [Planctomycetota bacterium]
MTVPPHANASPTPDKNAKPAAVPAKPQRVLVADDEHLIATDVSLMLGSLGYSVVGPATDGEAAVHLAEVGSPDLALLDIRMPKRDGLSAAKEIFGNFGIPVIILSAYSDTEMVTAAVDSGVFGYLIKPVREDQLRVSIDVAWQRYRDLINTRAETDDLRRKLEERKIVEQAKWQLVSKKSISEPEAMKLLQKTARDRRTPLVQIAQGVLDASVGL